MSRGLSDEAANRQISQMTQFIVLEARQKADEIRIKVRQLFLAICAPQKAAFLCS
jgi:uncharacterized protein (DUF1778 family)